MTFEEYLTLCNFTGKRILYKGYKPPYSGTTIDGFDLNDLNRICIETSAVDTLRRRLFQAPV